MPKPNIVLIVTDTQRWDTLHCMGASHAVSPSLDKLASEGVLFQDAYTAAPVCMPARVSLMSGYHTPIHGGIENGITRRLDIPMFPDALAAVGYRNIMVGKAHFGRVPDSFHVQRILKGEKGGDRDDFYAEHIRSHGYSRSSSHPNPIPPHLFMDAFLADTAIKEIDEAVAAGDPFFTFLSMPSPHSPNDPPGEWAHLFDDRDLPAINYEPGETEGHPAQLRRLVGTTRPESEPHHEGTRQGADGATSGSVAPPAKSNYSDGPFESVREAVGNHIDGAEADLIDEYRRLYYGLAAYCDAQVGRVVDHLDQIGIRENTLVIFTSDHGLQLFDHGFNDKHSFYDSSWHVPMIMSMPGTLPSGTKERFAVWTDITATIAGAVGAEMPWVHGYDLFTPLTSGQPSPRQCAVATLYRSVAMATPEWKLIYYIDEAEGQLFDRVNDPPEQHNLYNSATHRSVRDELLTALLAWRSDIADVAHLHANTVGGGPVANRIAPYTKSMRGCDADDRLAVRLTTI